MEGKFASKGIATLGKVRQAVTGSEYEGEIEQAIENYVIGANKLNAQTQEINAQLQKMNNAKRKQYVDGIIENIHRQGKNNILYNGVKAGCYFELKNPQTNRTEKYISEVMNKDGHSIGFIVSKGQNEKGEAVLVVMDGFGNKNEMTLPEVYKQAEGGEFANNPILFTRVEDVYDYLKEQAGENVELRTEIETRKLLSDYIQIQKDGSRVLRVAKLSDGNTMFVKDENEQAGTITGLMVTSESYAPEQRSIREVETIDNRNADQIISNSANIFASSIEADANKNKYKNNDYERTENNTQTKESTTQNDEVEQPSSENTQETEKQVENIYNQEQENKEEGKAKLNKDEAEEFVISMEQRAESVPEIELTPENWEKEFGQEGIIDTPIGQVKMGENQYFKLEKQGREGKLGMVKPTLTNPDVIIEDKSRAKEGDVAERESSYIFVKAFKKEDNTRCYYFTSVTVRKENKEVVISNQEKGKGRILNLLQKGKILWKYADNISVTSDKEQGLYSNLERKTSDSSLEGTDAPQSTFESKGTRKKENEKDEQEKFEEGDNKKEYKLSEQTDDNGLRFVEASNGDIDFGEITADKGGLTPAPIRLSEGFNKKTKEGNNVGYGLEHIEAGHGEQIRHSGFNSVVEFVEEVAKNYTTIRIGNKRNNKQDTYILEIKDKNNNTLFIELSKDGKYWTINSAGVFREDYSKNKSVVWSLPALENDSTVGTAGVQNQNKNGNSLSGKSPQTTDSEGKGTRKNDIEKDEQEKFEEGDKVRIRKKGDLFNEEGEVIRVAEKHMYIQRESGAIITLLLPLNNTPWEIEKIKETTENNTQSKESATKQNDEVEQPSSENTQETEKQVENKRLPFENKRNLLKGSSVDGSTTINPTNDSSRQKPNISTLDEQQGKGITKNENSKEYNNENNESLKKIGLTESQISNQLDQNYSPFIVSPNGNIDFGYTSKNENLPEAPIRLSLGTSENGYIHINNRHGEEIRKAGFNSILDFIVYVLEHKTRIVEGSSYDNNSGTKNKTYLIQVVDKHNNTLYIQLSRDGKYWNINSAGVFSKRYGNRNKEVWSVSAQQNNVPANVSDDLRSETKADKVSNPNVQSSILSESKGITKNENSKEREQEKKEEGDNKKEYKLSEQRDDNGLRFVEASDGGIDFGEITADKGGLTPAPIRLSEGFNDEYDKGYGLKHIKARHGEQILNAGYVSIEAFIEDVARNFDTIREGNTRATNDTYLLEITDKHNNTLYIELSKDGNYWNINSAGIFKKGYSKNKSVIWTLPTVSSSTNTNTTGVNHGTTKGATVTSGNSPQTTDSEGKSTTKTGNKVGIEQEKDEGVVAIRRRYEGRISV